MFWTARYACSGVSMPVEDDAHQAGIERLLGDPLHPP